MENRMASATHLCSGALSVTLLLVTLLSPSLIRAASTDALLISRVATGGSSASDEYVVIEAVGSGGASIADFELVYTTSSGATTRRLVSLEGAAPLAAGERLVAANRLGSFSAGAFATWSEGLAATGGCVRLRHRATPSLIADAVAWGSATTGACGFGSPAPAAAATTMLERRRGVDMALIDTQDNRADFALVSLTPPGTEAGPRPTEESPHEESPQLTPADLRATPLNSVVTLHGVVSAAPGELAEGRLFSVEDPVSGIGVFVEAQRGDTDLARGDLISITGTLILRRQSLTLAATTPAEVVGWSEPRAAVAVDVPAPGPWAWEPWEARAIVVRGVLSGAGRELVGGARSLTLRLPRGGELLVGVAPRVFEEIPHGLLAARRAILVHGVLHQRAGASGGGYRLWALSVAASPLSSVPGGSASLAGDQSPPKIPPFVAQLRVGTPSVATPGGAQPWWAPQVAQTLSVRGVSLELAGLQGVRLVVLPLCEEAQDVPSGIRAGGRVDRAERATYPE